MTAARTAARLACTIALFAAAPLAASAADHQVMLKNQGADGSTMVFEPAFVSVQPGDTVHFIPTDPGHNVETIPGMLPAGATALKGDPSKPYDVTFTTPGLYGVRCRPHFAMGMVGMIVVGGPPANLDQAKAVTVPGMAKTRMDALLAKAAAVKPAAKSKKHHA